jgi:radical SAM superfamily enzyme YgiQ (UPF0313 family)
MEHGVSVKIIDQHVDPRWKDTLRDEMEKKPIFIGVSSMSGVQIKHGLEISHFIKTNWDVPVVWGGVHPTLEPVSTAEHELVDIAVIGEGERTVIELVDYFKGKKRIGEVKGIAFKCNNKVVSTIGQEMIDLNSLPLIPFSLVDLRQYSLNRMHSFCFKEDVFIPLETSRGCSYRCTFCRESAQVYPWRAMSPWRVVEHIEKIAAEYNRRTICFYDDNFSASPERVNDILELLAKKNISIEWYANMRPDYLLGCGIPMLHKLEASGCKSLTIGLESGSDEILRKLDKKITLKELFKVNQLMAKTKIRALYVAILGFPYETLESVKQTYQMAVRILLENFNSRVDVTKFIPMPGARILTDCAQAGFCVPKTLEEWSRVTNLRLLDYSDWIDSAALKGMKDFDYLRAFITLTRSKPTRMGNFLLKVYARIILLRFRYDYFGLWLEPKVFSAIRMFKRKITGIWGLAQKS